MTRPTCQSPVDSQAGDRWLSIWAHHDELLRLARRRVVNESEAEDVVHEAMALAAADPKVELDRAGAWLNRVVRNRCADLARERSYSDKRVVYEQGRARVQPLTEDVVCDHAEAAYLAGMLTTLPSRQSEALLYASDGLSNAQIAVAMSTTVKAIESLLVKARRTLRMAAAAAVAGLAFLVRRPTRTASSAASVVALSVGLSVCIGQHPDAAKPQTAHLGDATVRADVVAATPARTRVPVTTPGGRAAQTHRRATPVQVRAHPRQRVVDVKAGPTHTKVAFDQYGSLTNPVPDTMACLRGGVVVSPSYIGCRVSPGRS
jgi:RNA polymerase sigma-70 factor (ECF subfamily)